MPQDKPRRSKLWTPRVLAFAHAYAAMERENPGKAVSATDAYRRAFPDSRGNENTVRKEACKLLRDPGVQLEVGRLREEARDRLADRIAVNRAWVIERLVKQVSIGQGEETVRLKIKRKDGAVEEVEVTQVDLAAANGALRLIGQDLGMFAGDTQPPGTVNNHLHLNLDGLSERELAFLERILGKLAPPEDDTDPGGDREGALRALPRGVH